MNNLKLQGIIKIIIPVIFIFLFLQCMHDEYDFLEWGDEIEINIGMLAPVAFGSLTLEDIISEFDNSGFISTDADGLLLLTYEDSLLSFTAEELLELPSQDFFQYFIDSDFGLPALPFLDTFEIDRTESFPFTFSNNERLDSMRLDEGSINFNIASDFQHTGKIDMIIPNLKLDGVPFTMSILIDKDDGTYSESISSDLANYTIYLQDSVGNDTMFFPVEFHVEIYTNGANPVNVGDQVAIEAGLGAMNFDAIFGYIGDYELLGEAGELDLGFFDSPIDGNIEFENPQINFIIDNSYGVPAAVDITRFTGFDNNGDSVQISFDPGVTPFRYAFPTLAEYGQSKDTVLSINGMNSTISEFLAFLPSRIEYNVGAVSNPDGPSVNYNFVDDNSTVDVGFEFILPLWFKADSFAFEQDSIELDLAKAVNVANSIEKVNVLLEVSNGLPMDIDFQLYFLDSAYNPVDTLFSEDARPIIESGILDANNKVIAPRIKISLIQYTGDEIADLNTVRYATVRAGLKTPLVNDVQVPVKFFSDYSVEFNLSVGVDVKANTNDF